MSTITSLKRIGLVWGVLLISGLVAMAAPVPPHDMQAGVYINNAPLPMTANGYISSRAQSILSEPVNEGGGVYYVSMQIANIPGSPPYAIGEDFILFIESEANAGTASHKGYYGIANGDVEDITTQVMVDSNGNPLYIDMYAIPTPTAIQSGSDIQISWPQAQQTTGNPIQNNIIGYNLYRSTDPASGFVTLNTTTIVGESYTDTTGNPNGSYFYAVGIVFKGGVASTSYSANGVYTAGAVGPDNDPPSIIQRDPAAGSTYGGLTVNVTFTVTDNISGVDLDTLSVDVSTNTYSRFSGLTITAVNAPYEYLVSCNAYVGTYNETVTVSIRVSDVSGNVMPELVYSFKLIGRINPKGAYKAYSYPNPASPADDEDVNIKFTLDKDGDYELYILNMLGQVVWKHDGLNGNKSDNLVVWDGRNDWGNIVPNGVYLIRVIQDDKLVSSGKISILD